MKHSVLMTRIAVASACGTLSVLAFAPFGFSPLAILTMAILFWLVATTEKPLQLFGIGMAFGFPFFFAGLWWMFQALSGYIGLPIAAAIPLMVLFCLLLSLFPALSLLAGRYLLSGRTALIPFACAAFWTLGEWMRGFLFTGFPWLTLGYSQIPDGWFAGWAPLAGIYGVSFSLTLAAASLTATYLSSGKGRLFSVAVIALLVIIPIPVNTWLWVSPAGMEKISLLQGNVRQALKWKPGQVEQALNDYLTMAQRSSGRIIIMPETALPTLLEDLPDGYVEALQEIAEKRYGAIITGVFAEDDGALYNAVAVLAKERATTDYYKRHLTPYGEYMPFESILRPLLLRAGIPYNQLAAGKTNTPLVLYDDISAGISICYEDAFGEEWRTQLPQAHLLINITNDSWFDGSAMAKQHLQISQARALEFGRWLVRATNTGETAIINQNGEVVSSLPAEIQGVLSEDVHLYRGATPYTLIGNSGAVFAAIILAALLLLRRLRSD